MIKNGEVNINSVDFKELCKIIDEQCKGNVYLVTPEGDRLNLKSKLCQLIGLSHILSYAEITEATLKCDNFDDEALLFRYNLYRKTDVG